MTNQQFFNLVNQLASQLEHFVDEDSKQMSKSQLRELLDLAERELSVMRSQLIRERDFGHQASWTF
jgi:hypothetical protein